MLHSKIIRRLSTEKISTEENNCEVPKILQDSKGPEHKMKFTIDPKGTNEFIKAIKAGEYMSEPDKRESEKAIKPKKVEPVFV